MDRLNAALRWAVECELIAANPLQHLRRLPEHAEHRRYRRRALAEDEIRKFIAASDRDDASWDEFLFDRRGSATRIPQTPLWIAFLETGARWGELSKAMWGDVDLAKGTLVLRAENTKSKRQRAVPLRTGLVERLRGLQAIQTEILRRLPTVTDRVCLTPDASVWPWHTANIMRVFDRVLEAAAIKKIDVEGRKLDVHALRHTAGTRMARAGVPVAHAQTLLGHSDPKTTMAVYTHLGVDDLRASIDSLPEFVRGDERELAS